MLTWLKQQDKTICKHVSSPSYKDQLIDDPAGAQNVRPYLSHHLSIYGPLANSLSQRVKNNRKVNGGKKIMIEEGKRRLAEAWDRENSSPLAESNLRRGQRQIADGDNMTINDGDSMVVNVSDRPVLLNRTPRTRNARRHTSDTPGASAQEQAKTPGSKRAAAKKAPATKPRKRKNDDESDSPYQPSGKRNTKKQPATKNRVKTEKPYNGKYPVVHDPDLNTDIISSVPSPPRSVPVPLQPPSSVGYQTSFQPTGYQNSFQPTDYQNPYQPAGYQNQCRVTGSREAYLASIYHNDYAPQSPIPRPNSRPNSSPVRETYEQRMRAAGLGPVDRAPLPQHVLGNYASFGHGLESSTRPSLFGDPHQVNNLPSSLFGGPHQVDNRRSQTVDPRLTGHIPLNPSQPLSELALPHALNTVGNEFDQNEPEPEELYEFTSLGHRRRRPHGKPDEFDELI